MELKNIIKDRESIPPQSQKLYYQKNELEDGKSLMFYGLRENETINLENKDIIQLFIKNNDNMCIIVAINRNATVDDLKKAIEDKDGIPIIHQRLVFENKQLIDGNNLQDYGINNLANINILARLKGGKNMRN